VFQFRRRIASQLLAPFLVLVLCTNLLSVYLTTRATGDSRPAITVYGEIGQPLKTHLPTGRTDPALPLEGPVVSWATQDDRRVFRRLLALEDSTWAEQITSVVLPDQPPFFIGVADNRLFDTTTRLKIIGPYALATLVTLAVGLYCTRRAVFPLALLLNAVERIERGEQVEPIPVRSQDEIGRLTEIFNRRVLRAAAPPAGQSAQ
jgi:hypothetical protein